MRSTQRALRDSVVLEKKVSQKEIGRKYPPPRRYGRSTNARGGVLQSRRSRRAHAEARAPMRGSSRVCRGVWRSRRCPARCAALRGARRRGAPAARGCWAQRPRLGGGAGAGHQQPAAAQLLRAQRRRLSAPRRTAHRAGQAAAGQHRGGRRTAPGSAANATHLDRRGLSLLLAPTPRRGRAATASIAGRRPAHSSNVHRDEGAWGRSVGPFLFFREQHYL